MADKIDAELVQADPGEFTVEDVVSVLKESSPEVVEAIKAEEAAGKNRATIAKWEPSAAVPEEAASSGVQPVADGAEFEQLSRPPEEPRFSRDRVLSPDGVLLTGQPSHIIAGAIAADPREDFTRAELAEAVQAFFERPAHIDQHEEA